jgi:hypothetical protein
MKANERKEILKGFDFLFGTYDAKNKGFLDETELRLIINDMRKSLGLDNLDDELFYSIKYTLLRNKIPRPEPTSPQRKTRMALVS